MSAGWAGAMTTLLGCFALAAFCLSRGWGDGPQAADGDRKLQKSAVPAVGGLAIALGWGASLALDGGLELTDFPWNFGLALACALLIGVVDDFKPGGLSPLAKLAGQTLTGVILVNYGLVAPSGAGFLTVTILLWVFLSMLSQNAMNTFDNADGATGVLAAVGLFLCHSPLAPAVAVFLIPNLLRRPGTREPWVYLGDGGSQMLGVAVLITPGAWPVLILPVLDLFHVAVRRLMLGLGPWQGDRRHLAHRLQRAGLGPLAVVAALIGLSAPVFLWPDLGGLGGVIALYLLLCFGTVRWAEPSSAPISSF